MMPAGSRNVIKELKSKSMPGMSIDSGQTEEKEDEKKNNNYDYRVDHVKQFGWCRDSSITCRMLSGLRNT